MRKTASRKPARAKGSAPQATSIELVECAAEQPTGDDMAKVWQQQRQQHSERWCLRQAGRVARLAFQGGTVAVRLTLRREPFCAVTAHNGWVL